MNFKEKIIELINSKKAIKYVFYGFAFTLTFDVITSLLLKKLMKKSNGLLLNPKF